MSKERILGKYKDRILAVQSFGENRQKLVGDFSDIDSLCNELYRLNTHELSLTDDGLSFLEEYYGLNQVVEMILGKIKEGVDFKYNTHDDLILWIKNKGE